MFFSVEILVEEVWEFKFTTGVFIVHSFGGSFVLYTWSSLYLLFFWKILEINKFGPIMIQES